MKPKEYIDNIRYVKHDDEAKIDANFIIKSKDEGALVENY